MSNSDTENIKNELKALAPILATLPKKSSLSVPPNYFEDVEELIISQLNLIKYDANHQVPHGYMDQFETDMVDWATQHAKHKFPETKTIGLLRSYSWIYAIAAIFTLIVGAMIVFNIQKEKSSVSILSYNEQDQYFDYIQNNIDEFDINHLIDNDLVEESDVSLVYIENEVIESESNLFMESEINF